MQFKVGRSTLLEAIKRVQGVVNGKVSVQVLNCIKVDADAGEKSLRFTATNLDMTINTKIGGDVKDFEVSDGGSTAVPAKLLSSVLSALPEGVVSAEFADGTNVLTLRGGSSVYRIQCMSASDFPIAESGESDAAVDVLPVQKMRDALKKVAYAQSKPEAGSKYSCVNIKKQGDGMKIAATDGKRLSVVELGTGGGMSIPDGGISIPSVSVSVLLPLLSGDGNLEVRQSGNLLFFNMPATQTSFSTKLNDTPYPAYERVIPSETPTAELLIDRAALLEAVDRVSVMASSTSPNVKLDFSDNQIVVSSKSEQGDAARDIVAVKHDGETISARFLPQYLREMLQASTQDMLKMRYFGALKPFVFVGESEGHLSLLMPLRLN